MPQSQLTDRKRINRRDDGTIAHVYFNTHTATAQAPTSQTTTPEKLDATVLRVQLLLNTRPQKKEDWELILDQAEVFFYSGQHYMRVTSFNVG